MALLGSMLLLSHVSGCDRHIEPVKEVLIEMTAYDFRWHSHYAGVDGKLETADDVHAAQVLHVPVDADVEIVLKSKDFIYTLAVPHADVREIAVPDMEFRMRFKADTIGTFALPGDQMCGYAHPDLNGTLIVESQLDYVEWLASQQ
jgi:heme/copper-type cytochrome/quinol oxidase subunit 2